MPAVLPRLRLLALVALVVPVVAFGQAWPTKPVRLVSPFPAGGGTDAFARPLAAQLSQQMGQQFIIDNRGGAGGTTVGDADLRGTGLASPDRPASAGSWDRTRVSPEIGRFGATTGTAGLREPSGIRTGAGGAGGGGSALGGGQPGGGDRNTSFSTSGQAA